MKSKVISVLCLLFILVGCLGGCETAENEGNKEYQALIDSFFVELKSYNVDGMREHLNVFPDKSEYVYLDDIFNDEPYQELYRILYPTLTYKVKSIENNIAIIEVTMPNIQQLYATTSMGVTNLALEDETLKQILMQDENKSIELIQQTMLAAARTEGKVHDMTVEFTLTFDRDGEKLMIMADDQLRALLTGNFYISKSQRIDEVVEGEQAVDDAE
ncbi:MAG: hypothetical protein IJD67_00460 [Clostridia bacterium]|nr:hypothetical protein [Clostridia bacterium]